MEEIEQIAEHIANVLENYLETIFVVGEHVKELRDYYRRPKCNDEHSKRKKATALLLSGLVIIYIAFVMRTFL